MKTKTRNQTAFTVKTSIGEEAIESLIVSALEGGSNYWYRIENEKLPLDKDRCIDTLKIIRGKARLAISEHAVNGKESISGYLSKHTIQRALDLMSEKHPRHFADIINENSDSETGDVFLQLAVLGEVIYG